MKQRFLVLVSVISILTCAQHTARRQSPPATPSFSDVSVTRPIVFERNSGQAPAEYAPAAGRTARVQIGKASTRLAGQLAKLFRER